MSEPIPLQLGLRPDGIQDFFKKLPRQAQPAVLDVLQKGVQFAELTNHPGPVKKRMAKALAKELAHGIDIPNVPNWIEDPAVDFIIDIVAALLFPLDSRSMRAMPRNR